MDDHAPSSGSGVEEDLGPPVTELKELRPDSSPGFLRGIRNRIERRAAAGQVLDLSLPILGHVLMEYLSMVFALFESTGTVEKQKEEDDE